MYHHRRECQIGESEALTEVREGPLALLILGSAEADRAASASRRAHPALAALRIVDQQENADGEIRAPFMQVGLLDRVSAMLGSRVANA
jgi:hypothetical protein